MNEVNDNDRLDQPLVRPPEEAASGEPQGVRPSVASELRARAAEALARHGESLALCNRNGANWWLCEKQLLEKLAKQAERERWTREHDRTA